jgi:hypothetical protein
VFMPEIGRRKGAVAVRATDLEPLPRDAENARRLGASMSANDALTLLTTQCGRPFNSPSAHRKVVRVCRLSPVTRDDLAFDYGGIFASFQGSNSTHPLYVSHFNPERPLIRGRRYFGQR